VAGNVSFDSAAPIELGGDGVWPKRYDPSQADYYRFEASAGVFYVLTAAGGDFSPDNVIYLYNDDHELIAQNDDGSLWPGNEIDARLVFRAERSGTYFARVADRERPADDAFAQGVPLPFYHFSVQAAQPDTPGYAFEAESQADNVVSFAEDAKTGYRFVTLLGDFTRDDDDVFAFGGRTDQVLVGEFLAPGPNGNGSTASFSTLEVDDAASHALARISAAKGQRQFHPPVTDGSYRLLAKAQGEPGSNGFYAIDLVMLPENPAAQADDANDALASAEPIAMQGSLMRRGLLLARLPPADVDYYSFDAAEGEHLSFACEAESGGSGVRGLHAEVRDADDQVLSSVDEAPDANLIVSGLRLSATANHYLRLSSTLSAPEPDMAEPWVRCVVLIRP
jgi:hypothetical protein